MTERTLVILRHAKADRPEGVRDADRPLTERGHADAAAAGVWLRREHYRPDLVICSPARRTRQTWHGVAGALADPDGRCEIPVHYERDAYEGGTADLLRLLRGAPATAHTVLVVGHNPTVSLLSGLLDPDAPADSDGLRTSGLAVHRVPAAWAELDVAGAPLRATHTARG
ncbi:MAG TPA: histidine phosphatase family protein [Pilimelia sp.]|nr:histidine phosphatase family protein [Pilimelia sp.]